MPPFDEPRSTPRPRSRPRGLWALGLILVGALASLGVRGETWSAVLAMLTGHQLEVAGPPVPATQPTLSEHNIEWVGTQPPQVQAEFLLGAAIRYERGATTMIDELVHGWRGSLERTPKWETLSQMALYSSDLRVRAAAIEIDLAVNGVHKLDVQIDSLIEMARSTEQLRPWACWTLGMLGNRGIQTERVFDALVEYTFDPDEETRIWAVEGLAHIGTDETIDEFLRVLSSDPSMQVRERAGCSLAKSGMLSRWQRMKAVPGLIELAENPSIEGQPRRWVYQALREITGVSVGDDPDAWREWYSTDGFDAAQRFEAEPWAVLGNH